MTPEAWQLSNLPALLAAGFQLNEDRMNDIEEAARLAEMLEDDCLTAGLSRRERLDYRIDAATAIRSLSNELSAWRHRFSNYQYRPQDDCVSIKATK